MRRAEEKNERVTGRWGEGVIKSFSPSPTLPLYPSPTPSHNGVEKLISKNGLYFNI